MAVAMSSTMPSAGDTDLMDIDIDMDLDDNGPVIDDEFLLEEGEEPSFVPSTLQATTDESNVIPAIYTEDPALEPQWDKVHIRGVDDFHTNDILAFANDHFPDVDVHIQWIDDTSANIIFKDKQTAREGILRFVAQPATNEAIIAAPFELRTAKPLASRPGSMLMVRVAQVGDRKRKNAHQASRYYLMHPDEDPTDRMRREFANGRASRGGENGDYRRNRFDDREHRRRRDNDHNTDGVDFAASMYDDAPATEPENNSSTRGRDLFSRISKGRRRSASPGMSTRNHDEIDISDSEDDGRLRRRRNGYRDRTDRPPPYTRRDPNPIPRSNLGKELFGDSSSSTPASSSRRELGGGLRSDRPELFPSPVISAGPARPSTAGAGAVDTRANAAAAKRLKADLLSAAQTSPRGGHHRRSHAMDAKNAEDLSERFARKSISIDETKSGVGIELFPNSTTTTSTASTFGQQGSSGISIKGKGNLQQGINIKGSAASGGGGLSIKGRAEVKELFPDRYHRGGGGSGNNQGKELFDDPVREKQVRRRAGDLFD